MRKIVILGGYGNFGKRIAEGLCHLEDVEILVVGRSLDKAQRLVDELLKSSKARLSPINFNVFHSNFEKWIVELSPYLVIHTSGPFQGQKYQVPKACIKAGAHYIDLADGREFVCGISELDEMAKQKKLLLVTGASSVPGLSSTVVEHFKDQFEQVDSIDMAIAPGNKAERGEATIRGILSYTGHSFKGFKNGKWQNIYGWMDARKLDMGDSVGKRWLANVDVPDLALFPERYQVKNRVSFQAGLEVSALHLTMVAMAWLSKIGLVNNWAPLTKIIAKTANWFNSFGTDKGGMQVLIKGKDHQGKKKSITWRLFADNGIGPYIPTISTLILAEKLIAEEVDNFGAMPCLGLYRLAEFEEYVRDMDIFIGVDSS